MDDDFRTFSFILAKSNMSRKPPCTESGSNDSVGNVTSSIGCFNEDLLGMLNRINASLEHASYRHVKSTGHLFFTYLTPFIFFVGIIGNLLSLRVFVTKNMRKLSASVYLAALSISDLIVLIFYVLTEWIKRGLNTRPGEPAAPLIEQEGMCQLILYIQYISRFMSAWLVVCFTLERYIGVCHPLRRKDICDVRSSRKIVLSFLAISMAVCAFKPWLSGSSEIGPHRVPFCTVKPEHRFLSFILDCVFMLSITLVPFISITALNFMIIRKLFIRNRRHRACKVITEESIIRLEFTIILIAISFCFIAFNTPYTVVWFKHFLLSRAVKVVPENQDLLQLTRTIFYMNYCVNFFLYSVTGAYFRKELQMLFTYKKKPYQNYHRCSVHNSNSNTPQSWL